MNVIAKTGPNNVATVYIAETNKGMIEFVESIQPPLPRNKKWVLIISTMFGCPVGCRFCDAGHNYFGKLTKNEIIAQIDYLIVNRFPDRRIPVEKFKIQFSRMGEPALNPAVLDVLELIPTTYDAHGFYPSLSTIGPVGSEKFFKRLLSIKDKFYRNRFQLQFSIHTTDQAKRDWLIPVRKWDFSKIGEYGELFHKDENRKVSLNFALTEDVTVDPKMLLKNFNPEKFLIKITPVNPTSTANKNQINSYVSPEISDYDIINELKNAGYDVILSVGDTTENLIGSNCGQHIMNYLKSKEYISGGYTYPLVSSEDKNN